MTEKLAEAKPEPPKSLEVRTAVGARTAKFRKINLSRKEIYCPKCNTLSKRHSEGRRRLREVGINSPVVLEVTYSKHYCLNCRKHFSQPMDHLAP